MAAATTADKLNVLLARLEALEAKQKEAETVSALKTSATTGTLATAWVRARV